MPITINGTTGISGVDGSTSTPAVIGTDADTGFVFAAGQITASLNGTGANVPLVQGTAQNSTSGTAIDFTGIPSWAKRITVMFNGVSTSGTSSVIIQIGTASGFTTSGYVASCAGLATAASATAITSSGFPIETGTSVSIATATRSGSTRLVNLSSNTWVADGVYGNGSSIASFHGGSVSLAATLTQVRITTVNGTDTFDAGSINILYE